MSVEVAKRYFELMDSGDHGTDDVMELYADDAVVHSSRAGVVRGKDDIRSFYEQNAEFFTGGQHQMEEFHDLGSTVVCEGYMDAETSVGKSADGVPLCDIMEFNDEDQITAFRAYLDYQGLVDELPNDVPNVHQQVNEGTSPEQ